MSVERIQKEIERQKKSGVLLVLTGPTAVGKDTLMQELLKKDKNLLRLVTTNSRPKRPNEVEGVDYYFMTRSEFERLMAEGAFLEWVEYLGHYKGTQLKHLEDALATGRDVIWRIDVKGVKNIKGKILEMMKDPASPVSAAAFVFLAVPDLETLRRRMERRATEDKQIQQQSLNLARWEMNQYDDSDYLVVNEDDEIGETVRKIEAIIEAERMRVRNEDSR